MAFGFNLILTEPFLAINVYYVNNYGRWYSESGEIFDFFEQ